MKLKFNEDNTIEELQHASPAKPGKHFQSFFIDCVLLMLVGYFIFSGAHGIAVNSNAYQLASENVNKEIEYYNNYVEESRAVEFEIIEGEKVRKDEITEEKTGISKIVLENVNRAIYYSYLAFGDFDKQFGIGISEEHMEIIKSSVSDKGYAYDDNISYFYTEYILNSNDEFSVDFESLVDAQNYVFEVYRESFGKQASDYFVFDNNQSSVPLLRSKSAFYLYSFIYLDDISEDILETSENYFFMYNTSYISMLKDAERIMIQSEPYYSTHYQVYFDNNAVLARCVNVALIISIMLSYLLVIVTPKFIIKHGRTVGRFLTKLGEISNDNQPISWKVILIKSIFGIFGYLPVIFLLYMFSPFNGVFNAMMYPFIGNMSLLVILIIIFIIEVVNGIFILFTPNKVGLDGLITKSILVDRTRLDELLLEEEK